MASVSSVEISGRQELTTRLGDDAAADRRHQPRGSGQGQGRPVPQDRPGPVRGDGGRPAVAVSTQDAQAEHAWASVRAHIHCSAAVFSCRSRSVNSGQDLLLSKGTGVSFSRLLNGHASAHYICGRRGSVAPGFAREPVGEPFGLSSTLHGSRDSQSLKDSSLHHATWCERSLASDEACAFDGELEGPGGESQGLLGGGAYIGPDGGAAVDGRA
jgi:hypothetical protein